MLLHIVESRCQLRVDAVDTLHTYRIKYRPPLFITLQLQLITDIIDLEIPISEAGFAFLEAVVVVVFYCYLRRLIRICNRPLLLILHINDFLNHTMRPLKLMGRYRLEL